MATTPAQPAEATPALPLSLIYILEAPLWGGVISVGLFGAVVGQALVYANNNRDGWLIRFLVLFVILADLANIIVEWSSIRFEFVENYGRPAAIFNLPKSTAFHGVLLGLVTFPVQLFFASRVRLLNPKNWILPGVIAISGLGGLICGILITIDGWADNTMEAFNTKRWKIEVSGFSVLNAISDIVATFALTMYLWGSQGKGVKSTRAVIAKLLRDAVTRGFVVTAAQIVNIVVYVTRGDTLDWVVLWWNLGKIYIMTMLAMLNARPKLKATLQGSATVNLSELQTSIPPSHLGVNITREIEYDDSSYGKSFQRPGSYSPPRKGPFAV